MSSTNFSVSIVADILIVCTYVYVRLCVWMQVLWPNINQSSLLYGIKCLNYELDDKNFQFSTKTMPDKGIFWKLKQQKQSKSDSNNKQQKYMST